ncbi:hlh transcription factor [Drepanopeziza brunnea f. sp. 'multigermtubi' MB_m1]|uniref:Hlh transcription factor n=1 Tax=Marssonina brunnea f. sp. multigermtubi (strain MB_m1) TaxID=1072389 RepID=K1Y7E8_MARBU|nr:hlh transcription factor [Drepanopeziza brunnea f. sp. 'multigermtubi' MB_m1]EKD21054.1 hlh transcription factor [Drepanopeziza brunnea f. sp. 'multigermtubi' MB_m1]
MASSSSHISHVSHVSQGLPTGLSNVLNKPDDQRDSAYYSSRDAASSKHNSTQSSNGNPYRESSSSTPSPISNGLNTQSLNSPTSGTMSVASIVSPTTYQGYPHQFYDHNQQNGDPRRESVDSRLGANFGDLKLTSSPYASANPSTTSLQSTLAQQRNPGSAHPDRNSGPFRLSSGYQPNYQRLPDGGTRNAPQITGPASGVIARAPEPTRGQAWAFPEEEVKRIPSGSRPNDDKGNRQGTSFFDDSRRNSYADSVASSQYNAESRLPAGQRRLDEGTPVSDYQTESSEFQMSTHHHSLQHRQLSELQGDGDSPNSSQPYSRTPELRVSHKLAERKRRLEMKDLFDNLRTLQSVERGAKASKWEILSKAITEHERQTKVIDDQKKQLSRVEQRLVRSEQDLDISRREVQSVRSENAQLRAQLAAIQGNGSAVSYHQPTPPVHQQHGYMPGPEQQVPHPAQQQLPPLRNIPGPEVMNGVQYHDQRANGYRAGDRF